MSLHLRRFQPADLPGIYGVCRRVDGAGRPSPLNCRNEDLIGHLYAGPYATADPRLAHVLADEYGIAGYVVATADARAFEAWLRTHWWPVLRKQYPRRRDPRNGTDDHAIIAAFHDNNRRVDPALEGYPARLHLKIEERAQGRGWGRQLVAAVTTQLCDRRVDGVHVGVAEQNQKAIGFYERLGFTQALEHDWGRTLVLVLDASPLPRNSERTRNRRNTNQPRELETQ